MAIDAETDAILAKPGREWTPEESRKINEAMKTYGRQALKQRREELNAE